MLRMAGFWQQQTPLGNIHKSYIEKMKDANKKGRLSRTK